MSDIRPKPETDAILAILDPKCTPYSDNAEQLEKLAGFARKLERERDEVREQLKAMRDAIKEACEALADLAERWEETPEWHNMAEHNSAWCGKIFTNVRQCKKSHEALAKLQPFIKP